ncbi:MAG: PAS domain S-box protein [Pseudomonadales bacterium]|nr:PAS domain S-box protein [Pseudomonadales bacterium]
MSQDLTQVNQALIDLSNGKGIIALPQQPDKYIQQLTAAVYAFEETLRQSEVQQLKLKNALGDLRQQKFALDQHAIVAITDVKGDITYANKRFSEISGYNVDELLGENHRLLNSGKHDSSLFTEMYKTISKGGVWHGELCNKN